MAAGPRIILTNDRFTPWTEKRVMSQNIAGTITSAPATTNFVVPYKGTITNVWLTCAGCGLDNTNALAIAGAITNKTTTNAVTSTSPKIKGAGTGTGNVGTTAVARNTISASTAVVQAVLTAANTPVSPGDILQVVWTLTRTASPTTEITDLSVMVEVTDSQDYDPNAG